MGETTMTKTVLMIGISMAITQAQDVPPLQLQYVGPRIETFGLGSVVTGSPFSAREERKTIQTLGDGTVIERADTTMLYRDAQGRTRVEQMQNGATTAITIGDPVSGVRLRLNPANRTAVRVPMPGAGGGLRGGSMTAGELPRVVLPGNGADASNRTEDLGQATQNGVMAQGTRTTVTIPQGQIGNNRDIHVVNERWYSKELQLTVKSLNSDPRFGTTTYELTNISRSAPDPMLFQAPADYTVTEQAGRGGRSTGFGESVGGGRSRGGR
jgi:hypothetical protein